MENKDDVLIALPINRRQLFKFTYRRHIGFLFKLSMLLSLFAIPLFVIYVLKGAIASDALKEITDESIKLYFQNEIYTDMLYIPAFLILSVGLAGGFTLIKQYAFQEGFIFLKSFFLGIKQNVKEFLLVTLFYGVIIYLINFAKNYLSIINFAYFVPSSFVAIVANLIVLCATIFSYTMIPIYKNSIFKTIKVSFLLTFNKLFKILGILAITILPLVIVPFLYSVIPSDIASIVMITFISIYIIVGFSHSVLTTSLYAHSIYDEMINKENFKEIYRKGLYNGDE